MSYIYTPFHVFCVITLCLLLMFLQLKVEPQEEGFMIKVLSQRSCQGLLAFILEAFERLGLEVLQARASCVESFSLEAFGIKVSNNDVKHSLNIYTKNYYVVPNYLIIFIILIYLPVTCFILRKRFNNV